MKLKMLSFSWKSFVSDNVISVTLMTAIWEITVLDNHSPLITSVRPSTLYFLYIDANWVEKRDDYAIWKWFVEVSDNAIKIMADMLVDIEDLDVWVAERARNKAIELMEKDRIFEKIEPGLQNWAGIWAMKEVLDFYKSVDWSNENKLAQRLNKGLKNLDLNLLSSEESSVQTFYFEKIDSHLVGKLLAQKNIMVRIGYFCCHYYLKEASPKPPLIRISLGLHNTERDIDFVLDTLKQIQQLN